MGRLLNITVALVSIAAGLWLFGDRDKDLPALYRKDHYWGVLELNASDPIPADEKSIKKFKINVPENAIKDLKYRIKKTRIFNSLPHSAFTHGVHSDALREVLKYWFLGYEWSTAQEGLNHYGQYFATVEGISVHYVHVKANVTKDDEVKVYPLMLIHGWPSSFYTYYKMIPLLINPVNGVAFELIIPSIPGYAWSEAPSRPGFNSIHCARVFSKLMTKLGHSEFYVHGENWGAHIGKALGALVPSRILGLHVTNAIAKRTFSIWAKIALGSLLPSLVYDNPQVDMEQVYPLWQHFSLFVQESGYYHLQATKPDTIGHALNDSPAGLAAYILEKFSTWTDQDNVDYDDGAMVDKFTLDELLTNIMVYWVTTSITSSMRFYKENSNEHMQFEVDFNRVVVPNMVPVGIVSCPGYKYVQNLPKSLLGHVYKNIVQYTVLPRGGHFVAFEEPELVAEDFRDFFKKTIFFGRAK